MFLGLGSDNTGTEKHGDSSFMSVDCLEISSALTNFSVQVFNSIGYPGWIYGTVSVFTRIDN